MQRHRCQFFTSKSVFPGSGLTSTTYELRTIFAVYTLVNMKTRKRSSKPSFLLVTTNGLSDLKLFCKTLNPEYFDGFEPNVEGAQEIFQYYSSAQRELRRLTRTWFESGPNTRKLLANDPVLMSELNNFRVNLIPTGTGRAQLMWFTLPVETNKPDSSSLAYGHFISFLLNPENRKLAGPCKKCDRYYIKKTKRRVVFCTDTCGSQYTSREWNRSRANEDQARKLQRAQRCLLQWANTKTRMTWKDFVHRETTISKNFLTRVEKRGLLVPPEESIQAAKTHTKKTLQ
jgi:hypothetical protein